jgi:hypothetical protein
MPAPQEAREVCILCYEHHIEMRLTQTFLKGEGKGALSIEYECTEPDCLVHYNGQRGYFTLGHDGSTKHPDLVPGVRCANDGMPMYLAEVNPQKRSFRLWRCPRCDGSRTNEQGLVGAA